MFAFLASMVLTALIYALIWRCVQRRNAIEEKLRREKLNAALRARENERNEQDMKRERERKREIRDIRISRSEGGRVLTESPLTTSLLNSQEDVTADIDALGDGPEHINHGPRSTDELGIGVTEAREDLIV